MFTKDLTLVKYFIIARVPLIHQHNVWTLSVELELRANVINQYCKLRATRLASLKLHSLINTHMPQTTVSCGTILKRLAYMD